MRPWSYSRLGTWESCPKQYEYCYIEKVQVGEEAISPAASRGQDIHDKAEQYLLGNTHIYPHELQKVAGHAMMLKAKKAEPEVKIAVREDWTPTDYEADDVYFRAIVDVTYHTIDPDYKIVHIEDWKTGQQYPEHAVQLDTYVAVAAANHPDADEFRTRLIYIDQGVITPPKKITKNRIEGMRIMLAGRVANAERDTIFPTKPGSQCRWCDYSKKKGGPCQY